MRIRGRVCLVCSVAGSYASGVLGFFIPHASPSYFHQSRKQTNEKKKNLAIFISHTNPILRKDSRSCYWKTNDRTEISNGHGKGIINAIMR